MATRPLLALLLALGLPACAAPPAPPLATALEAVPKSREPAPLRLAVGPLETAPEASLGPRGEGEHWAPIPFDAPGARAGLVAAAAAPRAFEEVRFLDALAEREVARGDAPLLEGQAFRVPDPAPEGAVVAAAFDARADLALTLRVLRHRVRYEGRNSLFLPNIANFFFGIWTAWLVADEQYAGEVTLDAEVRAVGTGARLWQRRYERSAVLDLDHFQRGWMLTGIFTVPAWLSADNYRAAGKVVLPYAWNEVAAALARDLGDLSAELRRPEARPRLAKTLAVVAGVGRHDALEDLATADADAAAFAALLQGGAGAPERHVLARRGAEPTRGRVLADLRDRAGRARPGDTVLFYFSGFGFAEGGEAYLVPSDLDPARPTATAISLAEVDAALAAALGARQVVLLDTSFAGGGPAQAATRTLPGARPGAPADEAPLREALERLARGRTLVVAAAPGRAATRRSPASEDGLGLLTASLVDAASTGALDQDRDGAVDLAEAFPAAQREARRLSKRAGFAQVPLALGEPGRGVVLARVAPQPHHPPLEPR
jgi:hypothetical protein